MAKCNLIRPSNNLGRIVKFSTIEKKNINEKLILYFSFTRCSFGSLEIGCNAIDERRYTVQIRALLPQSKFTREFFAVFTTIFFAWLVGPCEVSYSCCNSHCMDHYTICVECICLVSFVIINFTSNLELKNHAELTVPNSN